MNWYFAVLQKYAVFEGRAHRTEYWMFFLVNLLISLALYAASLSVEGIVVLYWLYELALFIPSLAVAVRRLHDTNRSGWWVLISLIPIIGFVVLVVFLVQDSDPGTNQYGPSPKAVPA